MFCNNCQKSELLQGLLLQVNWVFHHIDWKSKKVKQLQRLPGWILAVLPIFRCSFILLLIEFWIYKVFGTLELPFTRRTCYYACYVKRGQYSREACLEQYISSCLYKQTFTCSMHYLVSKISLIIVLFMIWRH